MKFTKLQLTIAGACLVGAVGIVLYRVFMIPTSSQAVAERAMACYQSGDARCLVSLASKRELEIAKIDETSVKKILDDLRIEFLGSASPVGKPEGEEIDGKGYSLRQQFKGADGVTFSVSFMARPTEDGFALDNLLVSILHSPLLSRAKASNSVALSGLDKILRLRQIAEYAKSKFGDTVPGVIEYGDLGSRVRTWDEIIAKYDTGLQARNLKPLPPLTR
jgi:hypothetical protein